jgi:o-succinylbenzoate---CoA ligase
VASLNRTGSLSLNAYQPDEMFDQFQVTTDWLSARTAASPRATALIDCTGKSAPQVWDFAQLDDLVSRLSGFLHEQGMSRGERVAVLLPNSLSYVALIFALIRSGAILVPLNTRLTANELRDPLRRIACARIICSPGLEPVARAAMPAGGRVIVVPEAAAAFGQWLRERPAAAGRAESSPGGDMAAIQAIVFTSGTTGVAKGAMLTFANHFWSAVASAFRLGALPKDRWLACLPLYHVGGLAILFRSCLYGTAVILHDGFEAQHILSSLKVHRATLVSLVPTMLTRLLRENLTGEDMPDLRLILLGGAPAAPDLLRQAARAGLPVAATYGLTEAASQVATALPAQTTAKPGSAGRPQLFTAIHILDESQNPLPPGEIGEIAVSGPTVMAGYAGDEEATNLAMRNHRLLTGDFGYLDRDGDLWVVDRRADLIVTGGENVYPSEVERVLRGHPAVAAACVIGLPDREWGRRVVAAVVPAAGHTVSGDDLADYCREHLAGYKRPREFVFVDELPQTDSGKIRRGALTEQIAARLAPA